MNNYALINQRCALYWKCVHYSPPLVSGFRARFQDLERRMGRTWHEIPLFALAKPRGTD